MRLVLKLLWWLIVTPCAFLLALLASPFVFFRRHRPQLDPDWLFKEKQKEQKSILQVTQTMRSPKRVIRN